jgi:cell fate regulator YaaT (PSP1 superfamily)
VAGDIGGLPELLGLATEAELARDQRNRRRRAQAKVAARRLVHAHQLPMKVVAVDYLDRDNRFVIYFSAPGRVDFRALVRDLARTLSARVDLRQVGARDEARVQGGIGPCGRDLCCRSFVRELKPIALRMARQQNLFVEPAKISGVCGKNPEVAALGE